MQHDTRLNAAMALATAMVFGVAFGAGTAIAGHDPGHEKLMQQNVLGPNVKVQAAREEMTGSDESAREAEFVLGGEILLEHERMRGSDVYEQHEGLPGPEPHE